MRKFRALEFGTISTNSGLKKTFPVSIFFFSKTFSKSSGPCWRTFWKDCGLTAARWGQCRENEGLLPLPSAAAPLLTHSCPLSDLNPLNRATLKILYSQMTLFPPFTARHMGLFAFSLWDGWAWRCTKRPSTRLLSSIRAEQRGSSGVPRATARVDDLTVATGTSGKAGGEAATNRGRRREGRRSRCKCSHKAT